MQTRSKLTITGEVQKFETEALEQKQAVFHAIYWSLRRMDEDVARAIVGELAYSQGVDGRKIASELLLTWAEFREMAKDPLVSFGAHTRGHYALAKLPEDRARAEIFESIVRLEEELGRPCRHISYPYGDEMAAG